MFNFHPVCISCFWDWTSASVFYIPGKCVAYNHIVELLKSNDMFKTHMFLNERSHCFYMHIRELLIWNDLFIVMLNFVSWLSSTLLWFIWTCYYFQVGLQIIFSDLLCVSDLEILSPYFILFIVWIAVLGKLIQMICYFYNFSFDNFTFWVCFYPLFL